MAYTEKSKQQEAARRWYDKNKEAQKARARVWNAEQREILRARMAEERAKGCMDCGGHFHPHAMEFDHVRGEKWKTISLLAGGGRCSLERFEEELAKCDVVCANCHRVRTFERSQDDVLD